MTERQQLLGLLALIYLGECLRWVRRGGLVLSGWPKPVAHRFSPFLKNDRGDVFLAWPLPPFGDFLVVRGIPFSLSTEGVLTYSAAGLHAEGPPHQPARQFAWTDLAKVRAEGAHLLVGKDSIWTADSPAEADRLARLLKDGAGRSEQERPGWISAIARSQFDEKEAGNRLRENTSALKPLRIASSTLWATVFVFIPAGVWLDGWSPTLWIGLPAVAALTGWIGRQTLRLHRQWYPDDRDDRLRTGLLTCLSPVTAIRATDLLARRRFEGFHPVAVASALLPAPAAGELIAALWRELGSPRLPLPALPESALRIETEWRRTLREAFAGFGRRIGTGPETWERPPKRSDPAHARFCPRCHAQATSAATVCTGCGGIPLKELPA